MKRWSAMLQSELVSWPAISTKSMFGFLSFYRQGTIFAAPSADAWIYQFFFVHP
jgi:hypothetical protein